MRLGTNVRNWGPHAHPTTLAECAKLAEQAGIHSIWVNDRLTTPPGSIWQPNDGGSYLDPLLTLSFLAMGSDKIQLGTGVVNAPYRNPLLFCKAVATLQALSQERLLLGVGAGWYETEFKALGVPFSERGKKLDHTLQVLRDAFDSDVISLNGEQLPMLPNPAPPPIYVGGSSKAAYRRAVRYGDGWIAAGMTARELKAPLDYMAELAHELDKNAPQAIAMKTLPEDDIDAARAMFHEYEETCVDLLIHADGYEGVDGFKHRLDFLAQVIH